MYYFANYLLISLYINNILIKEFYLKEFIIKYTEDLLHKRYESDSAAILLDVDAIIKQYDAISNDYKNYGFFYNLDRRAPKVLAQLFLKNGIAIVTDNRFTTQVLNNGNHDTSKLILKPAANAYYDLVYGLSCKAIIEVNSIEQLPVLADLCSSDVSANIMLNLPLQGESKDNSSSLSAQLDLLSSAIKQMQQYACLNLSGIGLDLAKIISHDADLEAELNHCLGRLADILDSESVLYFSDLDKLAKFDDEIGQDSLRFIRAIIESNHKFVAKNFKINFAIPNMLIKQNSFLVVPACKIGNKWQAHDNIEIELNSHIMQSQPLAVVNSVDKYYSYLIYKESDCDNSLLDKLFVEMDISSYLILNGAIVSAKVIRDAKVVYDLLLSEERLIVEDDLSLHSTSPSYCDQLFEAMMYNKDLLSEYLYWARSLDKMSNTYKFFEDRLDQHQSNKSKLYAIMYKGKAVGSISFNTLDLINKTAEIGYWLDSRVQGKGVLTKALQHLIAFYSQQNIVKRFFLKCAVVNDRSNAVAIRAGFKLEGTLKSAEFLTEQKTRDQNLYGLVLYEA